MGRTLQAILLFGTLAACDGGVTLADDAEDDAGRDSAGDWTGHDVDLDSGHDDGTDDGTDDGADALLDFSGCTPLPFRRLETTDYAGPTGSSLMLVLEDRAAFESVWLERYCYACRDPLVPPPALPAVDFATERVAWHHFVFRNTHRLLDPEVLDCGDRVVVRPEFVCTCGEMMTTVFTLVALPRSALPVEFAEPLEVTPTP